MQGVVWEEDEPFMENNKKHHATRKIVWSLGLLIVVSELYNLFVWQYQNKYSYPDPNEFGFNRQTEDFFINTMLHFVHPFFLLAALIHIIVIRLWPSFSLKTRTMSVFMYPQLFTLFYNLVSSLFNLFGSIAYVFESRHSPDANATVYFIGGQMQGITSLFYDYEKNVDSLGSGFSIPLWRVYFDCAVTSLFYLFLFLTQWNVLQLYLYSYHKAHEKARMAAEDVDRLVQ